MLERQRLMESTDDVTKKRLSSIKSDDDNTHSVIVLVDTLKPTKLLISPDVVEVEKELITMSETKNVRLESLTDGIQRGSTVQRYGTFKYDFSATQFVLASSSLQVHLLPPDSYSNVPSLAFSMEDLLLFQHSVDKWKAVYADHGSVVNHGHNNARPREGVRSFHGSKTSVSIAKSSVALTNNDDHMADLFLDDISCDVVQSGVEEPVCVYGSVLLFVETQVVCWMSYACTRRTDCTGLSQVGY